MTREAAPLVAVLLLAGCAGDSGRAEPAPPAPAGPEKPRVEHRVSLERARCPPDLPGCRTASGRIIYVERVDADGDGDAHFVLISRDSITGPRITAAAVKRPLRPGPLPEPGDRLSAAGQVFRGSFGQRQIEAVDLRVARR
jgi:hypothetical protein